MYGYIAKRTKSKEIVKDIIEENFSREGKNCPGRANQARSMKRELHLDVSWLKF